MTKAVNPVRRARCLICWRCYPRGASAPSLVCSACTAMPPGFAMRVCVEAKPCA